MYSNAMCVNGTVRGVATGDREGRERQAPRLPIPPIITSKCVVDRVYPVTTLAVAGWRTDRSVRFSPWCMCLDERDALLYDLLFIVIQRCYMVGIFQPE